MSKDIFDNELDDYLEDSIIEECKMCGKLINYIGYCTARCANDDEM